ncbi:MAG: hypothetical protein EOO38_18875 [Cytophagaceae bacterium]|nr:MAG: hypothetical protein EOO38_18875 [Cytophagaceae bacterium]
MSFRVVGTLLALPFSGIALQLPYAQAQPVQTPPTTINPIGVNQKAAVKRVMVVARQQQAARLSATSLAFSMSAQARLR